VLVTRALGLGEAALPAEAFEAVRGAHEQSQVFRVEVAARAPAYLKCHRHAPLAAREAHALRRWSTRPALAACLPRVLGHQPSEGWLLLSEVEGAPGTKLEGAHRLAMFEAAGRFRRELDSLRLDDDERDPLPLTRAWIRRVDRTLERAAAHLTPAKRQSLRDRLDPSAWSTATRSWCHRDFAPHNWRWDGLGLGVLDLGQARPDVWISDLVKLEVGPWRQDPRTRAAFMRGLGRDLSLTEQEWLAQAVVLWEVGSLGRRR